MINLRRTCPIVLIFVLALGGSAFADIIVSAPGGGDWTDGGSWIGGVAPGAGDDVVIDSAILVDADVGCLSLTLTETGSLAESGPGYRTLSVATDIDNQGSVDGSPYFFDIALGGDLINAGFWACHETRMTGTGDQHLNSAGGFQSALRLSGNGNLHVDAPFVIDGDLELEQGEVHLEPGSTLSHLSGWIRGGALYCNGNDVILHGASVLAQNTLDAAVLHGEVRVRWGVDFFNGLTVMDSMHDDGGNAHIDVSGTFVNNGHIHNQNYGLTVNVRGDLVNNGTFSNSYLAFEGSTEHHLSAGPGGVFDASILLPEFEECTVHIDSDVLFQKGFSIGDGTLILAPDITLSFTHFGAIGGGFIGDSVVQTSPGDVIHMSGNANMGFMEIDNIALSGQVEITDSVDFTGSVTVIGELRPREYQDAHATVAGLLLNKGHVRDNVTALSLRARGDIANLGVMDNSEIILDGVSNQRVGVGSGIDADLVRFEAGFVAAGYQWFHNNAALPGATAADLDFAGLGAADYGVYHCEGSGGEVSRKVFVKKLAYPSKKHTPVGGFLPGSALLRK